MAAVVPDASFSTQRDPDVDRLKRETAEAFRKLRRALLALAGGQSIPLSVVEAAGVLVRDNGVDVGQRRAINLHAGTNITLDITDDPATGEVDITVNASGGGGGSPTVQEVDGAPSAASSTIQFDQADGFVLSIPVAGTMRIDLGSNAVPGDRLQNDGVTNAKAANMPSGSIKANPTAAAADPQDVQASAALQVPISAGAGPFTLSWRALQLGDIGGLLSEGGGFAVEDTVDFGSTESTYAEIEIPAGDLAAVANGYTIHVTGGTADHPLADGDAALEELHATVVAIAEDATVTVGVYAPNGTFGQYRVQLIAGRLAA